MTDSDRNDMEQADRATNFDASLYGRPDRKTLSDEVRRLLKRQTPIIGIRKA